MRRNRSRPRRRHGVLLLIVLCVLFMFLLLAITYAMVASKERTVTRNYARYERSGDPPNVVLDEIAMMLFRDTNDTHSPFRSWSLLEGIYGNVSARCTISGTPASQAGGQFLQFGFAPLSATANSMPNYYKGCVLTMLSGQCAGLSSRIVASTGGSSPSVTVMRFQADAGLYDPVSGDLFLINGRPYCGMGRGYNTSAVNGTGPANNAVDPNNWPYALLPNPFGFQPSASYNNGANDPGGPGGANMDYTAADYNNCNLGLSLLLYNPATGQNQTTILPSFFRPALYSYWSTQLPSLATNATLLRKISFRPNAVDNPAFCANTNPGFIAGSPLSSYDVDNTGGGTPDSIWIDPGLPVVTMRDGRTAKVLVATCILDMDGRINVNAHGSALNLDTNVCPSTWQNGVTATSNGSPIYNDSSASTYWAAVLANPAGGGLNGAVTLPVGQGYGPPEINLNSIFSTAEVTNILEGASGGWPGRYGNTPGNQYSCWSTQDTPLEWVKLFELPVVAPGGADDPRFLPTTYSSSVYGSTFMSPPDLKGRRVTGIDPRGNQNYFTPGSTPGSTTYWEYEVEGSRNGITAESPYAFDLARNVPRTGRYTSGMPTTGLDNPFTVGELETCLRQYDVDVRSLPQRLYRFLPSVQPGNPLFNANQRNRITTESWDPPVPSFQAPRGLRSGLSGNGFRAYGISDLLNAKFQQSCPSMVGNSAEIAKLLPPELIAGLRMDINRPFGDGRSNNALVAPDSPGGNLAIANPGPPDASTESLKTPASVSGTSGYSAAVPFNLVNGSSPLGLDPVLSKNLPAGVQAQQLMARHLYALMMLFADQSFFNWTVETGLTGPQQQQLTARRIAQWAINAVSFRDATSIMTPFMYHWDIYQSTYQGWTVDGDPGNQSQSGNGNYGIVWACKPPDALLTETVAFHDKRIADTAWDNGANGPAKVAAKPPDSGGTLGTPNFDQTRIPQGSTFLEIYCTHNQNLPYAPVDLYTNVGTAASPLWELNLSKMSGDNVNPVWRLVISPSRISTPNADFLTATSVNSLATHPDTTTFEPTTDPVAAGTPWQKMNLFDTTGSQNVPIERVVWLGGTPPTQAQRATLSPGWSARAGAQIYYNRTGTVNVPPGGYAVIGPRPTTYIGSAGVYAAGSTPWGKPSLQKITVTPTVTVTGPNGVSTMAAANATKASPYATVGMVCAADPPPTWTNSTALPSQTTAGIGLNVSEPLPTPPTAAATSVYYPEPTVADASLPTLYDAYGDLTQTNSSQYFLDQPLEETGSTLTSCPLLKDAISKTGTTSNYRTVFLQRLADPTSGYDALRNPYITVDWMPIDLTVFNGEDLAADSNPNDTAAATPNVNFTSRQRGGSSTAAVPAPPTYNIWTPVQANDTLGAPSTVATAAGTPAANFPYALSHTLGSLNVGAFGPALTTTNDVSAQYLGDPAQPFPSIAWNGRPYVSPMELLNVPASAPERLLFEFNSQGTPVNYGTGGATQLPPTTPYQYGPQAGGASAAVNARAPYGHLLNFFDSSDSSYQNGQAPNFYRVLEYLHVPSRFIGCETFLNPSPSAFGYTQGSAPNAGTQYFQPPFNSVSNYREPGKMNLNTITDPGVLAGLLNGIASPTFAQLCDSRRCDGGTYGTPPNVGIINPSTTLPTYFGNPFRSAAGADLVPLASMMHRGVNATLLRAGSSTPDSANVPLFGANASAAAYNNTARNSYFTYQELQRISNLVTTRSNVFGVWLTIGYFEAVPWGSVDAGHPDGYQLGEEIGSDTGEVERHRAFYMFDRSIPVGYERGQNHNVNRAILLRRYIE